MATQRRGFKNQGADAQKDAEPIDLHIPDNYVQHTLATTKSLPELTWGNLIFNLNWTNVIILGSTTVLSIWAPMNTKLYWQTAVFSVFWYVVTALGITAGECCFFALQNFLCSAHNKHFGSVLLTKKFVSFHFIFD